MALQRHTTDARSALHSALLAMPLAALVLLTLLGHNRLTDWDEGIYAQVSREMLTTGWLVPHWNLQPWLEKPPLMLWITALFFKLFGVSEFTARLGSALSGVALVALVNGWLALRHGRLAAWLATVTLLATFGFLHVARIGEMDALLALGITLALIGLAELHLDHRHGAYLFWLGFAVALMTKGAASVTLALTLVACLALEPAILRRHLTALLLGAMLFVTAVLPWHLELYHRFGDPFLDQYLGLHVLRRATSPIEGHLTPWWDYLRVLLVSAAPFCLLYPVAIAAALRRPALRRYRVFALFALVELLFFSIVKTRLPHYIAPAYPALSVLVAVWAADYLAATRTSRYKLAVAAVAVFLLSAAITAAPRRRLHAPQLATGQITPDNREEVALLKRVFAHPAPQIASIPGPLLDARSGTFVPIPTTIFYANRPVQQVRLFPTNAPRDIYTYDPIPFTAAIGAQPSLILLDRASLRRLPADYGIHLIAVSQNLAIATITRTAE